MAGPTADVRPVRAPRHHTCHARSASRARRPRPPGAPCRPPRPRLRPRGACVLATFSGAASLGPVECILRWKLRRVSELACHPSWIRRTSTIGLVSPTPLEGGPQRWPLLEGAAFAAGHAQGVLVHDVRVVDVDKAKRRKVLAEVAVLASVDQVRQESLQAKGFLENLHSAGCAEVSMHQRAQVLTPKQNCDGLTC